jgi:hypothetical protein
MVVWLYIAILIGRLAAMAWLMYLAWGQAHWSIWWIVLCLVLDNESRAVDKFINFMDRHSASLMARGIVK